MLPSYFMELWERFYEAKRQLCIATSAKINMEEVLQPLAQTLALEYYDGQYANRFAKHSIDLSDGRRLLVLAREEEELYLYTHFEIPTLKFDLLLTVMFNKEGHLMKAIEFDLETVKKIARINVTEEDYEKSNKKASITFTKGYYGEYDDRTERGGKSIIRELQHSMDESKQMGSLQETSLESEDSKRESPSYSIDEEALQCEFIHFDGSQRSLSELIYFLSSASNAGLACDYEFKDGKLICNGEQVREGDYFVKDEIETFIHYPLERLFLEDFIKRSERVCIPAYIYEDMLWNYAEFDGTEASCPNIMWAIESYEEYSGNYDDYGEEGYYDDEDADNCDDECCESENKKSGYTIKDGKMHVETSEYGELTLEIGDGVSFNSYSYVFMPGGTPVHIVGGKEGSGVYKIAIAQQCKQSIEVEESKHLESVQYQDTNEAPCVQNSYTKDDKLNRKEELHEECLQIKIKGISFDLRPRKDESVQDFVKRTFSKLIEKKLLSDAVMKQLFDKQFCKETFCIQYALLQTDWKECVDPKGYDRYWKTFKIANTYYCCSQWWKDNFPLYKEKLETWLYSLKDE